VPLTVLLVGYPFAPVGPSAVGGAEQVLSMLDEGLVRAGHRVRVIAPEGSTCCGRLLAVPRCTGVLDAPAIERAQRRHREAIEAALARERVDLLHFHGVDFDRYIPEAGPPALVTLHLPPATYAPSVFQVRRAATYLHCVSASQRRACPPGAALLPEIPNGVRLEAHRFRARKKAFALALGRICPEKGFHLALDAAARVGAPLLLAGEVFAYPAHQAYFRAEIAPRLDGARRFLGPVAGARKRRLLAAARCLLVPSLVPETSSLAAREALASGTPVVAFPAGALPEIVEHGRTGWLVRDVEEMAEAIHAAGDLDPVVCRRAAEERCSAERMIAAYLATYRRVLA
jgi:glycosyltransferase involved in cell wall biosynthesis